MMRVFFILIFSTFFKLEDSTDPNSHADYIKSDLSTFGQLVHSNAFRHTICNETMAILYRAFFNIGEMLKAIGPKK